MKRVAFPTFLFALFLALTALVAETQVGPATGSSGAMVIQRSGAERQLITADIAGSGYEGASRNTVFSCSTAVAGTTIVAANNSPVGAAAASILSVFNPTGSGVNLELQKTVVNTVSGTPGAGAFSYNIGCAQSITAAGTAPVSNSGLGSSSAKCFTQSALTGSTAQVLLRTVPYAPFAGAIAANSNLSVDIDEKGGIVVPPGCVLSLASAATGTTHIVAASFQFRAAIP